DGRMTLDLLLDLGLPGLVFLGICVWLIRKAARAARTEADLEGERLQGALAEELRAARARAEQSQRPGLAAVRTADVDPLAGADVYLSGARMGGLGSGRWAATTGHRNWPGSGGAPDLRRLPRALHTSSESGRVLTRPPPGAPPP